MSGTGVTAPATWRGGCETAHVKPSAWCLAQEKALPLAILGIIVWVSSASPAQHRREGREEEEDVSHSSELRLLGSFPPPASPGWGLGCAAGDRCDLCLLTHVGGLPCPPAPWGCPRGSGQEALSLRSWQRRRGEDKRWEGRDRSKKAASASRGTERMWSQGRPRSWLWTLGQKCLKKEKALRKSVSEHPLNRSGPGDSDEPRPSGAPESSMPSPASSDGGKPRPLPSPGETHDGFGGCLSLEAKGEGAESTCQTQFKGGKLRR